MHSSHSHLDFIHTHAPWLKFESCTSLHLHSHPCVRSLRFDLLLSLPSLPAVPVPSPFPLPHQHEVHGKPVQLRASPLVTTLVMSWENYVMLEQRAHLPPNARLEVSVLFHVVSLRDLSRFHFLFSWSFTFCCLSQSMQMHLCGGKRCLTTGGD